MSLAASALVVPQPALATPSGPQAAARGDGDLDLAAFRTADDRRPGAATADDPPSSGPPSETGTAATTEGGLPEPARWLLMMIGVGMIGGALRGFVVANRALAKLQPDQLD
jgi:hypothetical protein